ncbi:MAG TPA: TolC family protein [Acidiferrobacterales bacterium]|nr:TolC family protein [Acidiferrobacterales bacterium]
MALVLQFNPVLAAQEASVAETARQRSWSSAATLGWTERGTEYGGAAGPNAGVSVRIPLFDRTNDLKLAQAQSEAARQRDAVLTAFLADVRMLRDLSGKVAEADDLRRLHRDRAEYWKQAVKEGRAEQDKLWPEAEAWKRAEHAHRQLRASLDTAIEITARRFGGEEWLRLQDLLVAITS